jgi:glycosyltransferase involved in cell wall biosynthesis
LKILIPWYRYPPFDEISVGGLSVAIWDLVHSLSESGISAEILCPQITSTEERTQLNGITVTRNSLGAKLLQNRKLEKSDLEFFKEYGWIVSVNNFGSKSLSGMKEKVVRQIHTVAHDRPVSSYLSLNPGITDYLRMWLQKRREMSSESSLEGTRSVCVSKYNLSKMIGNKLEDERNLYHIPNGVDTGIFHPVEKEKKFDLIFIGRFQRLKGLDLLLAAISILSKQGRKLTLQIVGSFTERQQEYCKKLVPEECKDCLNFTGTVKHEKIAELINSTRVLVAPSRYESFSLPTLEAQVCGVPVVATDIGGIPEIIENGGTGILVKPEDKEELASAIGRAVKSSSIQENALKHGPEMASHYDLPVISRKYEELFARS